MFSYDGCKIAQALCPHDSWRMSRDTISVPPSSDAFEATGIPAKTNEKMNIKREQETCRIFKCGVQWADIPRAEVSPRSCQELVD
jgi:hypothetical protein